MFYKLTGIPHVIVEVVLNSMLLLDIFIQTKLQGNYYNSYKKITYGVFFENIRILFLSVS